MALTIIVFHTTDYISFYTLGGRNLLSVLVLRNVQILLIWVLPFISYDEKRFIQLKGETEYKISFLSI